MIYASFLNENSWEGGKNQLYKQSAISYLWFNFLSLTTSKNLFFILDPTDLWELSLLLE